MSQTILTVEGQGKYVWVPELNLVDYIKKGERRPQYSLYLNVNQNTHSGALRKVSIDLYKATSTGNERHRPVIDESPATVTQS